MIDLPTKAQLYVIVYDDGDERLYLDKKKGLLTNKVPLRSLTPDPAVATRWIISHLQWADRFNMMYHIVSDRMHCMNTVWREKYPQYFKRENYKIAMVKIEVIL